MKGMKVERFMLPLIAFILVVTVFAVIMPVPALADVGNTFSESFSDLGDADFGSDLDASDLMWIAYFILKLPFPMNIIVLAIFIVGVVIYLKKGGSLKGGKRKKTYTAAAAPAVSSVSLGQLTSGDPDFSKNEFIAYAKDVFLKVQEAWEARRWELVRPFESNELFEIHNEQLQEYIKSGRYPHLDNQEIRDVRITGYEVDGRYEYLTVYLKASLLDFVTNDDDKLVSGSKTALQLREYKLLFKRVKGVKTKELKASVTNCPQCGAPTEVTSSGKCPYCSSVITTGEYGWVLDGYSAWNPNY